jgi:hypothetical protein
MPNYECSQIYKLVSLNLPNMPYYGSTTIGLRKRLGKHVSDWKDWKAKGLVRTCTSRIVIDAGYYDIIWIEDYPCDNKDQLKARERQYIENRACVNTHIPGRTHEEWAQANPTYQKDYRLKTGAADKIQCTLCSCTISRNNMKQHQQTAKCKALHAKQGTCLGTTAPLPAN